MTRKFILCIAAILLQQAASLAQTNPLTKYLPDNALMVMNFNVVRLTGKIPAESLQQNSIYKEMMNDAKMPIGALLKDPAKSGIDFFPGIFLAMTNDAANEKPNPGVNIFIKLSNADLFTTKMKELFKDEVDAIKTFGTDRIIQTGKGMTLGWNNDVFVMTSGYDSKIKDELQALPIYDSATVYVADTVAVATDNTPQPDYEKRQLEIQERLEISQRNICFSLLAPTGSNSFMTSKQFISMMNTVADIRTWNNAEANPLLGKMGAIFGTGLGKLKGLIGGSKTSAVNFENGKIVAVNNNYVSADVAAIYQKYTIEPYNTNLVRRLPKGKILGVMNISYNTQMGMDLLQKTGMKEMLDDLKKPLPFDIKLLYSALGNNMLVAVVKADEGASMDSITKSMDGIQLVIAMPIANKAKFEELKSSISHLIDSLKNGKEDKLKKGPLPVVRYNDSLFVVSLSPDVANAFLNNTTMGETPRWLQSKSEYPMLMNVNMKEVFKMVLGKKMVAKEGKEEQQIMNTFDQFTVYGGKYENESLSTTMEFSFTNATDNSLKQLFDLINTMTAGKEGRMSRNNEEVKVQEVTLEGIKQEKSNQEPPPPPPPKSKK